MSFAIQYGHERMVERMVGMNTREARKKVVDDFVESFSKGDITTAISYMVDDATWWVLGHLDGLSGYRSKTEFAAAFEGASSAMKSPIRLIPTAWTIEGDRVAVEMVSEGELKDGRKYDNAYHTVFEVREGKIQSVREYSDTDLIKSMFFS
jgi:ketosteroid isomerase-like protein